MAENIVALRQNMRVKKGLRAKAWDGLDILETSRKTRWLVTPNAAKSVDELTFTSRDSEGRINWWDVMPPKTDYWHVHEMLGRAYAFEVLDLLNNPKAEHGNEASLGFIIGAIARWLPTVSGTASSGMADGFFRVVSEYVATGSASR